MYYEHIWRHLQSTELTVNKCPNHSDCFNSSLKNFDSQLKIWKQSILVNKRELLFFQLVYKNLFCLSFYQSVMSFKLIKNILTIFLVYGLIYHIPK